ncbi:MAG TPA: uracil-DNA glycosylase family protein [Alphaproteobacteria bacterium]
MTVGAEADRSLDEVLRAAQACRLCKDELPLGPRPVLLVRPTSRLLIVSQAPGTRVHETGLPFNDRSGDRLRDWLGIDRETFYDNPRLGIMPVGLCYPGVDKNGGDRPPMKICAPTWHPRIRPLLPAVEFTLLVGSYAQAYYLRGRRKRTMTDTIAAWREYLPEFLPLPHPSWRNTAWLDRNPWFARDVLPYLRRQVSRLLALDDGR